MRIIFKLRFVRADTYLHQGQPTFLFFTATKECALGLACRHRLHLFSDDHE